MIKPEDKLLLAEMIGIQDPRIGHCPIDEFIMVMYEYNEEGDCRSFDPETNDAQRMRCIDWAAKKIASLLEDYCADIDIDSLRYDFMSSLLYGKTENQIEFCIELAKEVSGGN